jgi:exodeoxyribonuclease-3
LRLLSYNIRYGGVGRVGPLASVISASAPDVVVLQEANRPEIVEQLAAATGMTSWASSPAHSVGFMSRAAVASHAWHRPPPSGRAFLEIVTADSGLRIFGVHLTAVHSNWTERRRARELRALLSGIQQHSAGFHVVAGDFNTLAPGEILDLRKLPARLRALVWMTGRTIRWRTIQLMLDASYVDAFRRLHPAEEQPGYTFPSWDPHIRLDFAFLPGPWAPRLQRCSVVLLGDAARAASDHLPLLVELDAA